MFITPHGLICRQHALGEAIDQEGHSGEEWIPLLVKQPDSAPIRSQGEPGPGDGVGLNRRCRDPEKEAARTGAPTVHSTIEVVDSRPDRRPSQAHDRHYVAIRWHA